MQMKENQVNGTQSTTTAHKPARTAAKRQQSAGRIAPAPKIKIPLDFNQEDWTNLWQIVYSIFSRIVSGTSRATVPPVPATGSVGKDSNANASKPAKAPAAKVFEKGAVVSAGRLHLREKPVSGKVLTTVSRGTAVEILQKSVHGHPGWARVRLASGEDGYMSVNYLKFLKDEAARGKQGSVAATAAAAANMKAAAQLSISDDGVEFIASHEGFIGHPYNDPVGYATIGYGHLLHKNNVTAADKKEWGNITKKQGLALLRKDASGAEAAIHRMVKVPITQSMYDALISFAYNVGTGSLQKSSLLKKINKKDYKGAANEFGKWVYSNHKKLPDLVERRGQEKDLFCKDGC